MATKRNDPNYEQVSGYVPKDLALKFRIICTTDRLTQSDALEEALKFWIKFRHTEADRPAPTPAEPTTAQTATPPSSKTKRGKKE